MRAAPAVEISVVVGVRDGGPDTLPSLASVLAQDGVALELIVVDDGSADETRSVLADLAARDARVRVVRQEPEGLTAALARGCAAARAPLIARHDVGDLSLPGRLAKEAEALRRFPTAELTSCWSECVAPAGELLVLQRAVDRSEGVRPILSAKRPLVVAAGPTSHGAAMFRRSSYQKAGGYRRDFALGQDWDLWQRLGLMGGYVEVEETLYRRTLSPWSLTFAFHKAQIESGRLSLAAARLRAAGEDEEPVLAHARELSRRVMRQRNRHRVAGFARGNYHLGEILRRRGDASSRRYLADAIRARPFFPQAWIRWLQSQAMSHRAANEEAEVTTEGQ